MTTKTIPPTTATRQFSPFPLASEWDDLWSRYMRAHRAGDLEAERAVTQEIRDWHTQYGCEIPPPWTPGSINEALAEVTRG